MFGCVVTTVSTHRPAALQSFAWRVELMCANCPRGSSVDHWHMGRDSRDVLQALACTDGSIISRSLEAFSLFLFRLSFWPSACCKSSVSINLYKRIDALSTNRDCRMWVRRFPSGIGWLICWTGQIGSERRWLRAVQPSTQRSYTGLTSNRDELLCYCPLLRFHVSNFKMFEVDLPMKQWQQLTLG